MIRCIDWYGMSAVEFSKGDYTALLIPQVGANLVSLKNNRLGVECLHCPSESEVEVFKARPQIFGLPILFPPNRIEDGRYEFEGREYQYPITIAKENNYHHGILKSQSFTISKAEESEERVKIEARYYSNPACDAIYRHFPHTFKCKIVYTLSQDGLEIEVALFNKSEQNMPVGVGFHTPLNIPFNGGEGREYLMRVAVDRECELSERNLPTGNLLELDEQFAKLREGGLQTTDCEAIEAGFTLREIEVDGKPFRGAVVEHIPSGMKLYYEVDDKSRYWTIWNNGGNQPYCCPEPQTWITNAPNAKNPQEAGFDYIEPGKGWRAKYWLYVR